MKPMYQMHYLELFDLNKLNKSFDIKKNDALENLRDVIFYYVVAPTR